MSGTAMQSLWNSTKSKRALAGNVGGLPRVQEVLTPDLILDPVRDALGGTIGFDPCASTNQTNWFALENRCLPVEAGNIQWQIATTPREHKKELARLKRALKVYTHGGSLAEEWPTVSTFGNPHFDTLAPWMNRFAALTVPSILLCPVRTQRRWWMKHVVGAECIFLAPFPFVGSKSAFPAPLCLLARHCTVPSLGKWETGRRWL